MALLPLGSWAQEAPPSPVTVLPEVTVSVPRGSVQPFDVAGSVDRVEGSDIRDGRMQAQLSEGLAAVPGLQLQNRYNFAQDLQLSIRGFGARSTFGVRGVRLYVDGIPATLPDGQGQTANIDIASLDRVEILRGPFSALYGNSSGGVVQAFTATGEGPPRLAYSAAGGSFGTWRQGVEASGSQGQIDYLLSANRYHTDGWRDHSAATRDLVNGKLGLSLDNGSRLTLVFNRVRIDAQDPLGLTAEQFARDPRSAPLAEQYNTRKSVQQSQAGLLWEHRIDARQQLRVMLYGGQREMVQFQSIPPSAQQGPLHAGGVIDLNRDYGGMDVRWLGSFELAGRPFELAAGLGYDSLRERRSGYENYLGTPAAPVLGSVAGCAGSNATGFPTSTPTPKPPGTWPSNGRWKPACAAARCASIRATGMSSVPTATTAAKHATARRCRSLRCAGSLRAIWLCMSPLGAASRRPRSTSCPTGPMARAV